MITARDVMTPNPICVNAQDQVQSIVTFFLKNFISSAPVLDVKHQVIGQISELNLMRAFVKSIFQDSSQNRLIDFKDLLSEPQLVRPLAPLPDVVVALIHCPLHRVLVRDDAGHLKGIISPKDVLRNLGGENSSGLLNRLRELETEVSAMSKNLDSAQAGIEDYRHLFEDGLFMMHSSDIQGKVLMANPALHAYLGYGPKELIGKTIFDIYPATLHATIEKGLKHVIDFGKHELAYSSMVTKNGQVLRVEVISSSLRDDQGKFIGTVTLSRDVDGAKLLRALHGVLD